MAESLTFNSDEASPARVGEYPSDLVGDVTTVRGLRVHVRPIRANDAGYLVAFHERLSSNSVYRRYFSVHPELSEHEVQHLTCVDYADRMAFVVEDGDRLVAVGRYDRVPDTANAEVAFVVADGYQHQGIGLMLLDRLVDAARRWSITTFIAETQADNRDMMGVFESSGYPVSSKRDHEIISVHFPIAPTESSRTRLARRVTPPPEE